MTWHWLLESVIRAMQGEQIAEHGGGMGVRDSGLLASALARPKNKADYENPSVFDLAAAYAFGIIKNHPFIDGNKRTGFLAAYAFLKINGWHLVASETDAVLAVLALARGEMDEPAFSAWLERHSRKIQQKH
jgi:death on curing protein